MPSQQKIFQEKMQQYTQCTTNVSQSRHRLWLSMSAMGTIADVLCKRCVDQYKDAGNVRSDRSNACKYQWMHRRPVTHLAGARHPRAIAPVQVDSESHPSPP
jgi:hypothetical protein